MSDPESKLNEVKVEATGYGGKELVRRIVMECNASGANLQQGSVVQLSNGEAIFKPTLRVNATPEECKTFNSKNFEKGIVSKVQLTSVSSNCPEPVTVGLNLFDGSPNIVNSSGWLYAKQTNDMTNDHAHQNEGYTNMVTVLPHEQQRLNEVIYTPQNVLDNRYIEQYGAYTLDKLWEGIVPFSGEDYYYVDQDHVVMQIISQNWEQLGVCPQNETSREGKWMKVSKEMVKNCIEQLYDNVISQIPYTSFKELGARFQANTEGSEQYKIVCEMLVTYKFP